MFEAHDEGREFYFYYVFNKMAPSNLFIQRATHALENFWIIYIDESVMNPLPLSYVKILNKAGFDTYGF